MVSQMTGVQETQPRNGQAARAQSLDRRQGSVTLAKGATVGLIGGLVGTIVMDLALLAMHRTIGAPRSASFATIGDAAAVLCSRVGVGLAGGTPTGAVLHFLIGSGLGVVFGGGLARIEALHQSSRKRVVGLGALYALVMSQPLLAAAAITLRMTPAETAKWYGISVLQTVYGSVLGAIASRGLPHDSIGSVIARLGVSVHSVCTSPRPVRCPGSRYGSSLPAG